MLADVSRSHGGDGGGKGKRKPNLGGRATSRLNTRDKTRHLSLKEIMDMKGPVPIQFELHDKQTVMPLGDHVAHWSSYIGEVIRGVHLYYPSWLKVLKEQKATLITDIGTQFDLRPHMESPDWTEINAGIQQHLQKAPERSENITASEWDKYIEFWNDSRNIARAAQNRQNRAKSTVISRQGSRSLARLRDEMEEMRRLEAMGTYTDDEINCLAQGGKQQGHIAGVGRVLPTPATASPSTPARDSTLNSLDKKFESGGASESGGCGDEEEGADH
uniref:F-box domain, leucine-rich repeat domain, L domain-like protein n=1 Tax=Tanacetum cinerariifolium TaxID=118510 RepID=A0A6L2K0F1_TANCI|nr:F-box domain, leucine-rich repeat domain, L domain-like protein [Tanacetum cinerariifolium]